jgi:fructose-bisphosphate aldolase class II
LLLTPLQSRRLFEYALEKRFAILAVNADSPACVLDALEAARRADAPLIIETSLWQLEGRSFGAGDPLRGMARYLAELWILAESEPYKQIPVLYHTDHIKGPRTFEILSAAILGLELPMGQGRVSLSASTISLDSSALTEEENIGMLCRLAALAKDSGRSVAFEMEAGVDEGLSPAETVTRLVQGVESKHPGVLALFAPGLGSRHGLSSEGFPEFSPEAAGRNRALLAKLLGRPLGLALHGSSGIPEDLLKAAVAQGVVKVNWSSESLLLRSGLASNYYLSRVEDLKPGSKKFKETAMDHGLQSFIAEAYIPRVESRMRLLGGANQAREFSKLL